MASYKYEVVGADGKPKTGTIEAMNMEVASAELKSGGVEALQQDGHRHVHLHRLLVEQRRNAVFEEFQPRVDGRLHRTGQRGTFACGQHIRVAVHRLFDELIFAAAVIFLIPPLYFLLGLRLWPVGQAILVITHKMPSFLLRRRRKVCIHRLFTDVRRQSYKKSSE